MADNLSSNRRIAKNTVMLYIRMLLSIVVSLYTSRVVLNTLGVEDYGIYGVVGGVVAMFSFLNASMSGATSRFLTYEMGRGEIQRLRDTFGSALIVHVMIAVIVFILSETVGLWFLVYKLVIPENRMFAAHVVYQLSVFSVIVGITQVPYNAAIIAHEKMDIYAYVELLNVTLKLLIVFLLPILGQDKLIVYALLVFTVSIFIAIIYRVYCLKNYIESHFSFILKKDIIFPMLSFSGWDLYGSMSVSWRQQGMNFLLNFFFGPILNAASSIATTVQGVIVGLSRNVTMAYNPQIVKNYASQNYKSMNKLVCMSIKVTLALYFMIAIPAFVEIDVVLKLWLGIVPEYTSDFFRLVMIANIFGIVNEIIIIPIHASGRIKQLSFLTGSLFLMSLLPMYIALKNGASPDALYIVLVIFSFMILIVNFFLLKKNVENICIMLIVRHVLRSIILALCVYLILLFLRNLFLSDIVRLLFISFTSVFLSSLTFFLFQMNKEQRILLYKKIFNKNA